MYYTNVDKNQASFFDFDQPLGLSMDPENRWVKLADLIPWDEFEAEYSKQFKNDKRVGNIAKPVRMALGAMIIKAKYDVSDRELVDMIRENPYFQYFVGLPGYTQEKPFDPSLMVLFRNRITPEILQRANECMLEANTHKNDNDDKQDPPSESGSSGSHETSGSLDSNINQGTLIIDATCAPSYIRYPQDISLLNEAREKCEHMIDKICGAYSFKKPRMYRENARKDYLNFAKKRNHSRKDIQKAVRKQLGYLKRDLRYIENYLHDGYAPPWKKQEINNYITILTLYEQQEYMYKNKTHRVDDRIVSITQPYLRPIVRGKAKAPVEFGAKLDMSVDENGYNHIESMSFDAYNEAGHLIGAVENYRKRTGRYPERVLADQIYRNRENRAYCKAHGIRMSGPKLGRKPAKVNAEDRKTAYQDNTDRIEVERDFSLAKRCYGMGLIRCKLEQTTLTTIALSVFVMNLFRIHLRLFFSVWYCIKFSMYRKDMTAILVA